MSSKTTKVKNKIFLAVICALLVGIVGVTYSRYTSSATATANANLAKWNIELNGENISSQSKSFDIVAAKKEGVSNANVADGKIAPGQTLVAAVEVNPTGSEVAVDYLINVGNITTENFNTDSEIAVSKVMCTVDGAEAKEATYSDGNYVFFETLADVIAGKKVNVEAYVTWNDNDNEADTINGNNALQIIVPIEVTVRQHLASITTASTASDFVSAVASLNANDTLKLSEDIDLRDQFGETKSNFLNFANKSTLDLNNKTITSNNKTAIYHGNDLTIENGTFETDGSYALFLGGNDVLMDDNVMVENITLNNISTVGGINADHVNNVVLNNVYAIAHKYYAVCGNSYTQITINSGTYEADNSELTAAQIPQKALLMMYGVRVENDDAAGNPDGEFIINGGSFYTNGRKFCLTGSKYITPTIYGGTFDCDVSAYVAEGHTITKTGESTWVVE